MTFQTTFYYCLGCVLSGVVEYAYYRIKRYYKEKK